jgi:hypothetical protein
MKTRTAKPKPHLLGYLRFLPPLEEIIALILRGIDYSAHACVQAIAVKTIFGEWHRCGLTSHTMPPEVASEGLLASELQPGEH